MLPKQIERFRAAATRAHQHARTPEIVANLMVGLNCFLRFAAEVGVLSVDDAKAIRAERCVLSHKPLRRKRGDRLARIRRNDS